MKEAVRRYKFHDLKAVLNVDLPQRVSLPHLYDRNGCYIGDRVGRLDKLHPSLTLIQSEPHAYSADARRYSLDNNSSL